LVESLPFFGLILQQKLNFYQYKEPIWLTLQKADLLSQEQVDCILSLQSQNSQLDFSKTVLQKGWLKAETVNFFTREFNQLATKPTSKTIRQICRAAALLSDQQITEILKEQESTNLEFDEIALNKNWLTPKTIDFLQHYCLPRHSQK
jgi:response regulator of citrate/malate metabolism